MHALPVFVYGTLRHGLHNYESILDGNTVHEEPAVLAGAEMRDGGGCPFVSLTSTGSVVGEVMYLNPATVEPTMRRLDRLESFRGDGDPTNMYDRIRVTVTTTDGTEVEAWTYVAGRGSRSWIADMPVVASGDWKNIHGLASAH